jgi:outer membrane murein-binding lipoprotein Lpp
MTTSRSKKPVIRKPKPEKFTPAETLGGDVDDLRADVEQIKGDIAEIKSELRRIRQELEKSDDGKRAS